MVGSRRCGCWHDTKSLILDLEPAQSECTASTDVCFWPQVEIPPSNPNDGSERSSCAEAKRIRSAYPTTPRAWLRLLCPPDR